MNSFIHPVIYLGNAELKGRGMFCHAPLMSGTLIETSPVIIMSAKERVHLRATLLRDYIYGWLPDEDGPRCCVGLGYLSMYNHAFSANCSYEKNYDLRTISIQTVRDIAADEELTINYNGVWNDASPLWFDAA